MTKTLRKNNKTKESLDLRKCLKEAEEKYQLIAENALVGIYQLDIKGRFLFSNKAFAKMVGYRPKDLIGQHFALVLPAFKINKGKEVFKTIINQDQNGEGHFGPQRIKESYLHHKNGHDLYVQYSFNLPVRAKKKGYLSKIALTGTAIDITEHKKLEEELMVRTKTLENLKMAIEHEKVQAEAILNSIGDGVIATDVHGRIIMMNKSAEGILGWKLEELVGKKMTEALPLLDSDTETLISPEGHPLNQAFSTELTTTTAATTTDHYLICTSKSGRKFPVSITASVIKLNQAPIGAIGTFRDISRNREIDKAKSEFVSLASHQLRTPLTIIALYSEMLNSHDTDHWSETQKNYLHEIIDANKRMIKLVDMILNVSRIDMGILNVVSMPIDFVEISEMIWKSFLPTIKEKRLEFMKDYDGNLPILNSDPKILEVILENLISNAIKYTPAGGKISLSIKPTNKAVMIKVTDNGYGIPPGQQSRVFSKIFRADNVLTKDTEGTGLGLYIVKSMVEKMDGKIWFESEENRGTTFYVSLPATPVKAKLKHSTWKPGFQVGH